MDGIKLRNVCKTFRQDILKAQKPALQNLSLQFHGGQTSLILGANGAGKSTTMRIILGLVHRDSGEVLLGGRPIDHRLRQSIAYLPENDRFPEHLSCVDLIQTQLRLYYPKLSTNAMSERIERALAETGLFANGQKKLENLSKGLRRRAAWALVSSIDAPILILDEPFSGLDPEARVALRLWLEKQASAGKTIIFSTHDLALMPTSCDHVFILAEGQLKKHLLRKHHASVSGYRVVFAGATAEEIRGLKNFSKEWRLENYEQKNSVLLPSATIGQEVLQAALAAKLSVYAFLPVPWLDGVDVISELKGGL